MEQKMKAFLTVGLCPSCGETVTRPYPCSHAVCECTNPPTLIELKPVKLTPTLSMAEEERLILEKINLIKNSKPTNLKAAVI